MFLFCGRRRNRLKTLYWEGMDLYLYKSLENGRFQWSMKDEDLRKISEQDYPLTSRRQYRK
ncbi:MAG: transposase [Lachnospiraceae bacterium]|nr:transposase [Lachnospiraceae bacterium]